MFVRSLNRAIYQLNKLSVLILGPCQRSAFDKEPWAEFGFSSWGGKTEDDPVHGGGLNKG